MFFNSKIFDQVMHSPEIKTEIGKFFFSPEFCIRNGVKQGGLFSPILFTILMI